MQASRKEIAEKRRSRPGMNGVSAKVASAGMAVLRPMMEAGTPFRSIRSASRGMETPRPMPTTVMQAMTAMRLLRRSAAESGASASMVRFLSFIARRR